jgi:hypothetical protein
MTMNADPVMERFRAAAANFIQVVDSIAVIEREAFLARLSHCLAELYTSALDFPAVQPDTSSIDETPFAKEECNELYHLLRSKIGSFDGYWRVFDSVENLPPVQASLAADISEIYFDLKQDLRPKDISDPDFLWELRFSFRSHWGRHLLGALTAIHDRYVK